MHGYSSTDAKAKADSEAVSQTRTEMGLQAEHQYTPLVLQNSQEIALSAAVAIPAIADPSQQAATNSVTPRPSRKRRLSETAPHLLGTPDLSRTPNQESYNEEETWKRKAARYKTEMEVLKTQNASLRTQNDVLETRIQRLEANQDSLIDVLAARGSA